MSEPILAIFDLDYTITKQGTWGRFVWMNVRRRPHLWLPLLISAGWHQWRYKRGSIPRIRVKQAMMRWAMRRKPKAELLALAEQFAENDINNGLKPGAIKALQHHRDAGDTIMIASAAVDIIVEPISRKLGVTHFVATDMAWDADGRLAPHFASMNCYNEEKLARIKALIAKSPELAALTPAIAYSDSKADLPLLEFCKRGVAVDPNNTFKAIAAQNPNLTVETWK